MTDHTTAPAAESVADRAAERLRARRRWRVWINVAVFVLVTVGMLFLLLVQRDSQAQRGIAECHAKLAVAREEFQKLWHTAAPLPDALPLPKAPPPAGAGATPRPANDDKILDDRLHYFYNRNYLRNYWAGVAADRVVGVCCCEEPHFLFLQADGRHVILFDGQQYELRWMTESEFRQRAAALSLQQKPARRR